jgi:orotidine-5'-phosphate decarboxylase
VSLRVPERSVEPRVIVALDFSDPEEALDLVGRIGPGLCRFKLGFELFTAGGNAMVQRLVQDGHDIFLDLKFHDIPNTVARACVAAAGLGVWMLNVHALGGVRMLEAAREAIAQSGTRPLLVAVTVLTSHDRNSLNDIGLQGDVDDNVARLARLTATAGLDGVVCSAREAESLRREFGPGFLLVTPGIRAAEAGADDQRRTVTPSMARKQGADYLVIGRPITRATNPRDALLAIRHEIGEG